MTTPITKEWLQKAISEMEAARDDIPFGLDEDGNNTLLALKMALTSLSAEPVGEVSEQPDGLVMDGMVHLGGSRTHRVIKGLNKMKRLPLGTKFYTAPPAPVVSDEMPCGGAENEYQDGYQDGWNACRAAMLQGAEHVSNRDELPLGYLQGHKDGLEWAAQLAEANHPQTGDWLYDDPIALAAAIRKGPDMPELKSAFADEDDNFYSWFGRFWLENYQQNNYTTSAKQMLGTMAEFAFRAGRESATQAGNSPVIPDGWQLVPVEPTPDMREAYHQAQAEYEDADGLWCPDHQWQAMLAAAPQQERK